MARAYVSLDDLLKLSHRAQGFSFLPRQPVHSLLTGRHASRLRGRGLDFDELRHYCEGDDTRTIDWAATARLGTPYVRVYREERDRPVLLLVDQRVSMFFGSKRATKSVAAAEAAALSAFRVASLGDRVGGIVYSEQGITEVEPQARQGGVRRLLAEIVRHNNALRADVPHPPDPGLYNEALRRALRMIKHDGLVVMISDGSGKTAETVKLATEATAHNDLIAVFVYDPVEAELPVRVVFDHQQPGPLADVEHLLAALLGQRHAGRVLERRDRVDELRPAPLLGEAVQRLLEQVFKPLSRDGNAPTSPEVFESFAKALSQNTTSWVELQNRYYRKQLELWSGLVTQKPDAPPATVVEPEAGDRRSRRGRRRIRQQRLRGRA